MGLKFLMAGMVGGIVAFMVAAALHMATHLGDTGVQNLPNESTVLPTLRASIPQSGMYFFPPMAIKPGMTEAEVKTLTENFNAAYKTGPVGMLIYKTGGDEFIMGKHLAVQFMTNLASAFLITVVLVMTVRSTTFGTRLLIAFLIGIYAPISALVPQWNWYGFPVDYTAAQFACEAATWLIAGVAMAAIVSRPRVAQIA